MKRKLNKKRILAFVIAVFSFIKVIHDLWILPDNMSPSWITVALTFAFGISLIYMLLDYEFKKEKD